MKALVVICAIAAGGLLMWLVVWARNTWSTFTWPSYILQVIVAIATGVAVWRVTHEPPRKP